MESPGNPPRGQGYALWDARIPRFGKSEISSLRVTDINFTCFGIPTMTHFRVGVVIGTLSKISEAFAPMGSRLKTRISFRYSAFFAQRFCHGPTVYSYLGTHNSELYLSLSRSGPIAVIQIKAGCRRSPHRGSSYLRTATHPIFPVPI